MTSSTKAAWLCFDYHANEQQVAYIEQALTEAGALAVTLTAMEDHELFQQQPLDTPLWPTTTVTGLFNSDANPQQIETTVNQLIADHMEPLAGEHRWLAEQDWVAEGQRHFQAKHFGNNLWVCPSWLQPPDTNAINIILDPGLAFGTGTHATTSLCLDWLSRQDLQDKVVVDYGCGSGILALAACLLGSKQVIAVDHDPQAIQATYANAKLNQIDTSQLKVLAPHELTTPISADILLANILAEPLISLADQFKQYCHSDSHVILSGILEEQITKVQNAYENWCTLNKEESAIEDGWARLVSTCRQPPR